MEGAGTDKQPFNLKSPRSRRKMGFFLQLKLLLWKNLIIRKRNKFRCVMEILWPLFLFLILMWVRTRGLKEHRPECHYLEKAMPSAGQAAFYHSLFCNAPNHCHVREPSPDYSHPNNRARLADLIQNIGELLLNRGSLQRVGRSVEELAGILTRVSRNESDPAGTLRVRDLVLYHHGAALTDTSLLEGTVDKEKFDTAYRSPDPKASLCDGEDQDRPKELCQLPSVIWEHLAEQSSSYNNRRLDKYLLPWEWHRVQILAQNLAIDVDEMADGKLTDESMSILAYLANRNSSDTTPPQEGWCDTIEYLNEPQEEQENDFMRMMRGERQQIKLRASEDPGEPPECRQLYNTTDNIVGVMIWRVIKPFITGRILYTPDTPATRSVMTLVNQTFNRLLSLPGFESSSEQFNPQEAVQTLSSFFETERGWTILTNSALNNSPLLRKVGRPRSIGEQIQSLRNDTGKLGSSNIPPIVPSQASVLIDSVLKYMNQFSKCLNRDKVKGFNNETEALQEAVSLVKNNNLWALVVFDAAGNDTLEPFVKYRIRMSAARVDGTMDMLDRRSNVRSRDSPLIDLKYITFGFAYLQDMIESAVLKLHTGRDELHQPGRTLQQSPYPAYIFDQFIKAISNTFPMFMVLAWVYTSSMLVKSIVYEKEQRIKETFSVMGLSNGVQWAGWFIDSMASMTISSVCMALILVYGKVVENSSFTLVLVFLLSFCVATVFKSFLISVFFSKANVAAAATGMIYFLVYTPYPFLTRFMDAIPYWGIIVSSLSSNIAFGLGTSAFALVEQAGEGMHWDNFNRPATPEDIYTLGTCIRMLWLDALIYALLTWYIEAVWPGEYGVPRPYYFFLTKSYWLGPSAEDYSKVAAPASDVAANNFEPEPSSSVIGVAMQGLTKVFGKKIAVSGLSLNFYEDQITCFLGHNGAGKTTTISMLTGMYPPTRGSARVYGLDIRTDMDSIRCSIGVCPQHNVLYDSLTVEEHLWFFGRIKGQEEEHLQREIDRMLSDMGLTDKRHALSSELSGGMKRKLSVGMAFVGGSRTVFLDEPTAGVDPFSRRAIWELLIKYREGRTVVLTTHFMDEADLLGDRIAIINAGRLQCYGSSVFLKSRFGSGYYLTVEWTQRDGANADSIGRMSRLQSLVHGCVGSAQLVQELGPECVFVLPDRHDVQAITKLLAALDESRAALGIESYGISDTSLEEIFLKVAEEKFMTNGDEAVAMEDVPGNHKTSAVRYLEGWPLIKQQFIALCYKRLQYERRNPKGLFTQLVLPAIFVAVALLFTSFFHITTVMPEMMLETHLYSAPWVGYLEERQDPGLSPAGKLWADAYENSMLEDGIGSNLAPARAAIPPPNLSPRIVRRVARQSQGVQFYGGNLANCTLDDGLYTLPLPSGEVLYNLTRKNVPKWIVESFPYCRKNRYGGVSWGSEYPYTSGVNLSIPFFDPKPDNVRIWYNNKGHTSSVTYLNAINNVILRASLPADKKSKSRNYGILVSNHPLPLTESQLKDKSLNEAAVILFHAVAVIFAMSFVPASFVILIIDDRVGQSKHLQLMSGMRRYVYWTQSFIWDLLSFCVSEMLVIFIFMSFNNEMYTSGSNLLALTILIFFYGIACIPLLYLFSWMFNISSMAFVVLSCGNLFVGMVTTLTVQVLGLFQETELFEIKRTLEYVFLVFPQYCLGQGLMNLALKYVNEQLLKKQDMYWEQHVLAWTVTGIHITALMVQGAICLALVFIVEYFSDFSRKRAFEASSPSSIEPDVVQEMERVISGQADSDVLVLKHLSKSYSPTTAPAVNRVSFGVRKGECFGLLGLNGAGKTSIFKMLTGATSVTNGEALVSGLPIRTQMDDVRKLIGYCPQFDALVQLLTVREHLDMHCRLRGMHPKDRAQVVERVIRKLNLGFHQDKLARSLSGGNKRKLSTAIALLGDPPLLFMDEPTTSMDPAARRFLWDCVLSVVNSGRSVVLTSHSMEECQALCTKLTIMVNGQLMCFGSPQHLKNKYGSGYSVVVRCPPRRVAEAEAAVTSRLEGCVAVEAHLNQVKFHIPQSEGLSLLVIFRAMDDVRRGGSITDYSISQTTLEDVFMRFAQLQVTDDPAPRSVSAASRLFRWMRHQEVQPADGANGSLTST